MLDLRDDAVFVRSKIVSQSRGISPPQKAHIPHQPHCAILFAKLVSTQCFKPLIQTWLDTLKINDSSREIEVFLRTTSSHDTRKSFDEIRHMSNLTPQFTYTDQPLIRCILQGIWQTVDMAKCIQNDLGFPCRPLQVQQRLSGVRVFILVLLGNETLSTVSISQQASQESHSTTAIQTHLQNPQMIFSLGRSEFGQFNVDHSSLFSNKCRL